VADFACFGSPHVHKPLTECRTPHMTTRTAKCGYPLLTSDAPDSNVCTCGSVSLVNIPPANETNASFLFELGYAEDVGPSEN
jgi:hypothetical protein